MLTTSNTTGDPAVYFAPAIPKEKAAANKSPGWCVEDSGSKYLFIGFYGDDPFIIELGINFLNERGRRLDHVAVALPGKQGVTEI